MRILLLHLMLFLALEQSATAEKPTPSVVNRWNVILITVDALRADRMSLYGNTRDTTPNLNRFAKDGIVFENVFAASAHTSPGIISLLTGQVPPVHAQTSSFAFYDPLIPTPVSELVAHGYDAIGYVTDGANFSNLGFTESLNGQSVNEFLEQRAKNPKPFFAWIHTKDTHLPYRPAPEFKGRFTDYLQKKENIERLDTPLLNAAQIHRIILRDGTITIPYAHAGSVAARDGDNESLRALYDECVLSADARIGVWLDQMQKNGLLDRSIVVFSADHGDELLEHGWLGHASTNYDGKLTDEILKIPLIIRVPGGRFTGRYKVMTSQVDVMPTVFDLLKEDNSRLLSIQQGRSLLPVLRGALVQIRDFIFAETTFKGWTAPREEVGYRTSILRTRRQKYVSVVRAGGETITAYDLKTDPNELKDEWFPNPWAYGDIQKLFVQTTNEYRATAAKMVFAAAEKHIEAMEKDKKLDQHRKAIKNLEDTWGMERFSFLAPPENQKRWQEIKLRAEKITP